MLSQRYPLEQLEQLLIPHASYRPFLKIDDRDAWTSLPEPIQQAHIGRAETDLGFDYPSLPATLFLQFSRMGNLRNYEKPHFIRRSRGRGFLW